LVGHGLAGFLMVQGEVAVGYVEFLDWYLEVRTIIGCGSYWERLG